MSAQTTHTPESAAALYRFLGLGVTAVALVFAGLNYAGIAPILPPGERPAVIAYALVLVSVVLMAVALLVIRPRMPRRLGQQPLHEFWALPAVNPNALLLWFILEAAGMVANVGFLLTGHSLLVVAILLALFLYWSYGPDRLAAI